MKSHKNDPFGIHIRIIKITYQSDLLKEIG